MDNLIDMIEDGCVRTAIRMVKENWNDPEVVGLIEHTVTDELDVSTTPLLTTLNLLNYNTQWDAPSSYTSELAQLALLLIETGHSNSEHAGYFHYLEDEDDEDYIRVSKTALMIAITTEFPEITSALIKSGKANLEYINELGMNALMIAAVHNNIDAAKQIIDVTTPAYWRSKNRTYNQQTASSYNKEVKQLIREKKKEILNNNIQADRIGKNARLPLEIIAEIKTNLNNGSVQTNFAKIQMKAQKATTL